MAYITTFYRSDGTTWISFSEISGAQYGYGWVIAARDGQPMYYHPGDNAGFAALVVMLPASDTQLILLANDEDVDVWKLSQHLLRETLAGT
jgi:hypothetical protein